MPRNGSGTRSARGSTFGCSLSCCLGSVTGSARTPCVFSSSNHFCIFRRPFVALFAMSAGTAHSGAHGSSQGERSEIASTFFVDDLFVSKSLICALNDCIGFVSTFISKVCRHICLAFNSHSTSNFLIAHLLSLGGPTAVLRCVVPIVVNSINRMLQWTRPHVFDKLFKVVKPLRAYLYAPSAITVEVPVLWFVAAGLHIPPCVIKIVLGFGRHLSAPVKTMCVGNTHCPVTQLGG